ncbi:MAG TPA: hypothetical protein RMG48_03870 [Myxococcales bacterium LLY-WYZ-16_1]|nr:hypothetical protein [Myxococcales bacterium LLY-WYZ-16_1]
MSDDHTPTSNPPADPPISSELEAALEQLHPIAAQIVSQLNHDDSDPTKEPYTMDPEVLALLGPGIEQYIGDEDFESVMRTMNAVVDAFKTKLQSPQLAASIQQILEQPHIKKAWTDLRLEQDPEKVQQTAREFAQFSHTDQVKKAPTGSEGKPKGAKSLDELGFPRRL